MSKVFTLVLLFSVFSVNVFATETVEILKNADEILRGSAITFDAQDLRGKIDPKVLKDLEDLNKCDTQYFAETGFCVSPSSIVSRDALGNPCFGGKDTETGFCKLDGKINGQTAPHRIQDSNGSRSSTSAAQ